MYTELFIELGLVKNEAKIYETLLRRGESAVSTIAAEAAINRRNVYDTLNRLIEKGLIFEIRRGNENAYVAVDPEKLTEGLKEKEMALNSAMPALKKMFQEKEKDEAVYIYRGIEGWKNYMRDILRVGEDVYTLGGKGLWADPALATFLSSFTKQAKDSGIKFNILFDHEIKKEDRGVLRKFESAHRFLPAEFSTSSTVDIFGDNIVFTSCSESGGIDENASFTVVVNKKIADSLRAWFKFMWQVSDNK